MSEYITDDGPGGIFGALLDDDVTARAECLSGDCDWTGTAHGKEATEELVSEAGDHQETSGHNTTVDVSWLEVGEI